MTPLAQINGRIGPEDFPAICHVATGVCLLLLLGATVASRLPRPASRSSIRTFLNVSALTAGLVSAVTLVLWASIVTSARLVGSDRGAVQPEMLYDLVGLIVAVVLWRAQGPQPQQAAVLYWLLVLGGLWAGLCLPAGDGRGPRPWTLLPMAVAAAAIAGLTVAQGWIHYRRRATAWPHHLDRLTADYPRWDGLRASVGTTGLVLLVVGSYHMVLAVEWYRLGMAVTMLSSAAAGVACLMLAGRRWRVFLGDLGAALVSMAVVSLGLLVVGPAGSDQDTPAHWPVRVNAVVAALAVMTWLWGWLAAVWTQQLDDDGTAWTTAGRMIAVARQAATALGGFGVLVALNMAIWPLKTRGSVPDDSAARWVCGLGAPLALAAALLSVTLRHRRNTDALLSVAAVVVAAIFAAVRVQHWPTIDWMLQNWAIVLAGGSVVAMALALLADRPRWRPMATALATTAMVILPGTVVGGVAYILYMASGFEPRPDAALELAWLGAGSLGLLGVTYALASLRLGLPTAAAALAALNAAAFIVRHRLGLGQTGAAMLPIVLAVVSLGVLFCLARRRRQRA